MVTPENKQPHIETLHEQFRLAVEHAYEHGVAKLSLMSPAEAEALAEQIKHEIPPNYSSEDIIGRKRYYGEESQTLNRVVDTLADLATTSGVSANLGKSNPARTAGVIISEHGIPSLDWHSDEALDLVVNLTLSNSADMYYKPSKYGRIRAMTVNPGDVTLIRGRRYGSGSKKQPVWHSVSGPKQEGERVLVVLSQTDPAQYAMLEGMGALERKNQAGVHERRVERLKAQQKRLGGRAIIWSE